MPITVTTIEVSGGVTGTLWMPAVTGWKQVEARYTYRDDGQPFAPRADSLREALEDTISRNDGDFQGGKLTGDTRIVIRRRAGNRTVSRVLYVDQFPQALAEIVDFGVYSYDGESEE